MSDSRLGPIRKLIQGRSAKLVAVILATITWYVIQPAISFEATISDVPLRVQVDSGWAVLEQSIGSVDVHFRGSREGIRYLSQEQLEVMVDARGADYGDALTLVMDPRSVRTPRGVRAVFVRPSEVTLTIDQEEDIIIPVRVHIQGNPPEGYEVESVRAVPSEVTVSGPGQRLQLVEAIRTTPIDMEGRLQSFKLRVGLVSPSRTWAARIEPERVEVEVDLVERSSTVELEDVRIHKLFGQTVWSYSVLDQTHANIKLVGRADRLESLVQRDVRLYVDLSNLEPGEPVELPIRAHLPARVRAEEIRPETIRVQIGETPIRPLLGEPNATSNQNTNDD